MNRRDFLIGAAVAAAIAPAVKAAQTYIGMDLASGADSTVFTLFSGYIGRYEGVRIYEIDRYEHPWHDPAWWREQARTLKRTLVAPVDPEAGRWLDAVPLEDGDYVVLVPQSERRAYREALLGNDAA